MQETMQKTIVISFPFSLPPPFFPSFTFFGHLLFNWITHNKTHKLTEIWRIAVSQENSCEGEGQESRLSFLGTPTQLPSDWKSSVYSKSQCAGNRVGDSSSTRDRVGRQSWYHEVPGSQGKRLNSFGSMMRSHFLGGRESGGVPNYQHIVKETSFYRLPCFVYNVRESQKSKNYSTLKKKEWC